MAKFTSKQFAIAFVGALQDARLETSDVKDAPTSDVKETSRASEAVVITRAAKVLRDSGGSNRISQITEAIENVWQEKTGARKYTITSALSMTDAEKKSFAERLQSTSNDYLEYKTEEKLVAGVVIQENESRVLDLSFTKRVAGLFKN